MTDYVIAIDGGGTSCRAAVADRAGRVVGRGMRGAANIFSRPDAISESIVAASLAALEQAAIDVSRINGIPAFLGLAGLNVGMRQEQLAAELPFSDTRFAHDGIIALQGALGDGDGVIAILGTGSAYVARAAGEVRSAGGWGFAVGDQASGAVIGRMLLQQTLLARDGIRPMTPLASAVMARFGDEQQAVVEFTQSAKPADYGSFAPMIFTFDAKGDPMAAGIIAEAVGDITETLDAMVFEGCERLCLLGGLAEKYGERLAPRHRAILRAPLGDPLSGAVQLALRAFLPAAAATLDGMERR